jgi:CRP/FNR family transcriptional regulator, cyclic AMP receptor protein
MPKTIVSPDILQEDLLRAIAITGGIKTFPANAIIINEGDETDSLYIILSGSVKVYGANEAGREVIYDTHGPGEYVGEMALDGGLRSASVMTLIPTTCSIVNGVHLRDFLATHPDFALHLTHKLIRRARIATENMKSLALLDVYGRVARLLLELAVEEDGRLMVKDKLTQQDIADRVGSSREMVSRIFKDLIIGGYLSVEAGHIILHKKPPPRW